MAGYSSYSMSNNAVAAYERGLMPFSKLPKAVRDAVTAWEQALPARNKREHLAEEWHHTSKRFNVTYFYCPNVITDTDECPICESEHIPPHYLRRFQCVSKHPT